MADKRDFPKIVRAASLAFPKAGPRHFSFEGNKYVNRYDDSFIHLVSELLGFKLELFEPVDKQYGYSHKNGTWTGIIGMVHREEVDIGFAKIAMTEERNGVVDFSYPYLYGPVTFITDKPTHVPDAYAVFYPFSLNVWIAVIISLFLIIVSAQVCKGKKEDSRRLILAIYAILLENSLKLKTTKLSFKILTTFWVVGVFFIVESYKAVLLSFLTFPTMTGIRDIADLAKASESSSFMCSTLKGGIDYNALKDSTDKSWNKIADCMDRSDMFTNKIQEFLQPKNYKKAFVALKFNFDPLSRDYFIPDDNFYTMFAVIVVRKTFCCKKMLDDVVHKVFSTGILDKFLREEIFFIALSKINMRIEESDRDVKLSLQDVSGAFIFLIFGFIFAIIAFVFEIICGRKTVSDKKKRRKVRLP